MSVDLERVLTGFEAVEEVQVPPAGLFYGEQYGFLQTPRQAGQLRLLGFGNPRSRNGTATDVDVVYPMTNLSDVPEAERKATRQLKGVGPCLYATPHGVYGLHERPERVGVYLFSVGKDEVLDRRPAQGSAWRQAGRTLLGLYNAYAGGLETAVAEVHEEYGSAEAVLLHQPPQPLFRQRRRGVPTPEGLSSAFLLIRNPSIVLHRIGTVALKR